MAKITDLEQKGLVDALGIEEKDLFEAGHQRGMERRSKLVHDHHSKS